MNRLKVSLKIHIIIACCPLLLLFMTWVPTVYAVPYKQLAVIVHDTTTPTPTVVAQSTPTVDPTITALTKQQLNEQVIQLQRQNERSISAWFWSSGASFLAAIIASCIALFVGFLGFTQWRTTFIDQHKKDRKDRHVDQQKRAEESFQKVVEELGSDKEPTQVGGAIMLHTFLEPAYKQFYRQIFELAVAYLQLHRPSQDSSLWLQQPNMDAYKPPNPLSQALATVFKRSFPKVRDALKEHEPSLEPRKLDARGIHLENADLYKADLELVWMPDAFLHNAFLQEANLSGAQLGNADLTHANLTGADLSNADLSGAHLNGAYLSNADLSGADFSNADLTGADLTNADLGKALDPITNTYSSADLTGAKLKGANPQDAKSLDGTIMNNVEGLEEGQPEQCKRKGAIFEEIPDPLH